MATETFRLQYGSRPGLNNISRRICVRCWRVNASLCVVHARKWWQMYSRQEMICIDCHRPEDN